MEHDKPINYKIKCKLSDDGNLELTAEVQSYDALRRFPKGRKDGDVVIVVPSVTCPEGDLKDIENYCKKKVGFSYQPPVAPDPGERGGGGSGEGDDQSANKGG